MGEKYRSLSSSLCELHFPITLSLLGPDIFLCTLFSNALSLHSPSMSLNKFNACTKQQAKLYFCIS
jgi:hypothetical protein